MSVPTDRNRQRPSNDPTEETKPHTSNLRTQPYPWPPFLIVWFFSGGQWLSPPGRLKGVSTAGPPPAGTLPSPRNWGGGLESLEATLRAHRLERGGHVVPVRHIRGPTALRHRGNGRREFIRNTALG